MRLLVVEGNVRAARERHRATYGLTPSESYAAVLKSLAPEAICDIALPADTKASRLHARLVADGGGIAVEDAGSTNGTFVNGQRVTRQTLMSGDTIVIGTTTLRYE